MPISVVPQVSMRSMQSCVQGMTQSPNFWRNLFQLSSTGKSNFAGSVALSHASGNMLFFYDVI